MGVGEHHGGEALRGERKGLPVQAVFVLALMKTAIDEYPALSDFKQVTRTGDFTGSAEDT
jgi:hypothetical protein